MKTIYDFESRLTRLKGLPNASVALISTPTPILMTRDNVLSPNRTNYFPYSQVILGTSLQKRFEAENIPWTVSVKDYKSIENIENWHGELHEYGKVFYGGEILRKYRIGNGLERLQIELQETDVIGISANFTFEASVIREAIQTIRTVNPKALILVGGRDAMARSNFYLRNGADIVALGDSDTALPEFLIQAYQGKQYGEVWQTGILLQPEERFKMDRFPLLNFGLIAKMGKRYIESGGGGYFSSVYNKGMVAYYETSRGCYRECDFCTERLKPISKLSLPKFYQDIAWYKKNHVSTVMFSDDNLLLRMNDNLQGIKELIMMFQFLRRERLVWEFPVGLEMGKLIEPRTGNIIESLFDVLFWSNDSMEDYSGVFRLLFPLENLFSNQEKKYSKMRDGEFYFRLLENMILKGIPQINLGIIIGWPGENEASIETLKTRIEQCHSFCQSVNRKSTRKIKTHINYSLFCLTPLPGTPLYRQLESERRIVYDIETDPELWSLYTSVIQGDTLSPHETTKLRSEVLASFDSRQINGKVQYQ